MEGFTYIPIDGALRSASLAEAKRAIRFLLVDAPSAKDIRCIALWVDVPPPTFLQQQLSKGGNAFKNRQQLEAAHDAYASRVSTLLKAAHQDASLLGQWAQRSLQSSVPILVYGALRPRFVKELDLFSAWQQQPSGGSRSPLRYASAVVLKVEDALDDWVTTSERTKLESLLLPYQHIILDLTWCARPLLTWDASAKGMSKNQRLFRSFCDVVQKQLVVPSGGRCAIHFGYHALLHHCQEGVEKTLNVQRQLVYLFQALCSNSGGAAKNKKLVWTTSYGHCFPSPSSSAVADVAGGEFASTGLRFRRLRDVHALLGILLGYYAGDLFNGATHFIRVLLKRHDRAGWLTASLTHSAPHVVVKGDNSGSSNSDTASPEKGCLAFFLGAAVKSARKRDARKRQRESSQDVGNERAAAARDEVARDDGEAHSFDGPLEWAADVG